MQNKKIIKYSCPFCKDSNYDAEIFNTININYPNQLGVTYLYNR